MHAYPEYVNEKLNGLEIDLNHAILEAHYDFVESRINVKTVPPELLGGSSKIIADGAERLGLNHGPLPRNISRVCTKCPMCVRMSYWSKTKYAHDFFA